MPNSPKQWVKRPETPHQKAWIKIPTLPDLNSPRKWEMSRRSASPDAPVHPWPTSTHKLLDSSKPHWLNIPRPDSPKQHWAQKPETAKNWMPINLPKVPVSHKAWQSNQKKSELDLIPDWNSSGQRNQDSGLWISASSPKVPESPKIWLSPNHKRPGSPSWISSSQKRSDSPKNWSQSNRQTSELQDKNSSSEKEKEDAVHRQRFKSGKESQARKMNEEEENNEKVRSCAIPSPSKSWPSTIPFIMQESADSSADVKHLWVLPPENAPESKPLWNENAEVKREANTPTFIKTPIWPK